MTKSTVVIILLLSILITGCTVYSELYVRNTTTNPAQVTLITRENAEGKQFQYMYSDSLIKQIRYRTYNYLDKKMVVKGSDKSVSFSMPPNSTLHLGAGTNFSKQFEKMIIGTDTIDLNTTGGFQTKYERFSKYAVWYDVK